MQLPHIGFYERALFSFWRSAGMALYFVKTLVGVSVISFLLAYLLSEPFVAFFQVLAETQNPLAALWSFAWHFVLEIINPWMWFVGFIASRYFIVAAGHSIEVFNVFLKASDVEIRHVRELLDIVKKDRRYFISLVAVPHVLFGIFSAALAAFAPAFSYGALMGIAVDFKEGLPQALFTAAVINLYFVASVAVVAGFIAIIWFAAARRTAGVVSDRTEDMYGRKLFG